MVAHEFVPEVHAAWRTTNGDPYGRMRRMYEESVLLLYCFGHVVNMISEQHA